MEVHAHTHTARKKWTHYFWEFLMLFLAVFCGFLAEYQLEHKIERDKEKVYAQNLLEDLKVDTAIYSEYARNNKFLFESIDTPDPLLLALPGAPLPELIIRVKPLRAELYDKTIGDKIDAGIRGYIESYTSWLGAKSTTEGPPLLREVALGVTVMCTRERRVTREFTTIDDEATQPLVQNGENTAPAQNTARLERAARRLVGEIEELARNVGSLCGARAAPALQPSLPSLRIDAPAAPVVSDPAAAPASSTEVRSQ